MLLRARTRWWRRLCWPAVALLAAACAELGATRSATGRRSATPSVPVVFVPGVTGSRLVDAASGHVVWGDGSSLLWPRDDGYAAARPLRESAVPTLRSDRLLLAIRVFGVWRRPVFQPLLDGLVRNGYRLGDLVAPRPEATLYPFAYDWRQDNVESAAVLLARLDGVRRARRQERLQVDLVCQSNGAHICRYLSRYGGASLEAAEHGATRPQWLEVRKLVLAGTSNGGSLAILRLLQRGRRYLPLCGRPMRPEVLASFPSLYQDLPSTRRDLFLDAAGRELPLDLFDVAVWKRLEWSWFDAAAARRIDRRDRRGRFADGAAREAFLTATLGRAQRFQRLLRWDDWGVSVPAIFMIQNTGIDTAMRVVVEERRGETRTLFPRDSALAANRRLWQRTVAPGDGHATVESQLWLSAPERAAVVGDPVVVPSRHWAVLVHPRGQEALAAALAAPLPHAATSVVRERSRDGAQPCYHCPVARARAESSPADGTAAAASADRRVAEH